MGRGGEIGVGTAAFAVLSFITVFVSCFLLGFSFDTLEPDKFALMFNKNTRELECDRLYGAERGKGSRRWFTGLGRGFYDYKFPLAAHTLLFSSTVTGASSATITTKTSEGATVTAELAVQYQLPRDPQRICDLYFAFGLDYESFLVNYVRGTARDIIAAQQVQDMWTGRPQLSAALRTAIAAELSARAFGVSVVNFQLLSVDIPVALQAEIETTTVEFQKIAQASLTLQAQNVSAITTQLQAQVESQRTVIAAGAAANATLTEAVAQASSQNLTSYTEAQAYATFKDAFNLTNAEVLQVAYIDALLNTGAERVSIALSSPGTVKN